MKKFIEWSEESNKKYTENNKNCLNLDFTYENYIICFVIF